MQILEPEPGIEQVITLLVTKRILEPLKSCKGLREVEGTCEIGLACSVVVLKAGEFGFGVVNLSDRIFTSRSDLPVAAQLWTEIFVMTSTEERRAKVI